MRSMDSSATPQGAQSPLARTIHQVERGGRVSFLTGVTGQAIRFCFQTMLGRVLGAHAYGLYELGHSTLEIASRISLVGLQNGVVRFLAIFRGEGDDTRVRGTILYAMAIVAVTSSCVAFCLWLSAGWVAERFFREPSFVPVLRGFAISLPFYALLTLLAHCARGFRSMKYYTGMTDVIHPLGKLLMIAGAFWIGMKLEGAIWGFILSTGLALLLMIRFMFRLFPQVLALTNGCLFEGKRILIYSSKVAFIDFSKPLLNGTDRIMLGYFGVARDVGIYSVAAFVGIKIGFFQTMFNGIFAPIIADLHNKGRQNDLVQIFKTVSKWTLLLTLPLFFTFFFAGHFILALFGHEFRDGWSVLVVLAVAKLIDIGVGPAGFMLIMTDRTTWELMNGWASGVSGILLSLWLIPQYGALGAALATGISITIVNLMRLIEVYFLLHCHPFRFGTLKTLVAFALSWGGIWQLNRFYPFEGWWSLVAIILFMLVYLGLLAVFGWDEEDKLVLDRLGRRIRGLLWS